MNTFLNINLEGDIPKKFLWKHFLFSFIWILAITVILVRLDVYAVNSINEEYQWIIGTLPIVVIVIFLITIFSQKWYYSLVAIFYPLLLIFWFIPKTILAKGKIYLFGHYINYIYLKFKHLRSSIIHFSVFFIVVTLLLLTDDPWVRGIAILSMSYFYVRFIIGYIKTSFKPAELFGSTFENLLEEVFMEKELKGAKFISMITEATTEDKTLSEEEKNMKKLRRLVLWNYGINYMGQTLSSFRGTKAYVISWVLQLSFFILISIIFFTFTNYQLFKTEVSLFVVTDTPNLFEFLYYTIKSITFTGIESIKPNSIITKLVEIASFIVIGVFILIIAASVMFSLRKAKIKENVRLATDICNTQNQLIIRYIETDFDTNISSALEQFSDIKKSLENLKSIINKFF